MLNINHSSKLFYNFNLNKTSRFDNAFYSNVYEINESWHDIEYLNFLFHKSFGEMTRKTNSEEHLMLFQSVKLISLHFYVHLEIIRQIFKTKLLKEIAEPKF